MEPDSSTGLINISDVMDVINNDEMESAPGSTRQQGPKIVIKEQPASKALRFRYECEGRSAGSIPGVNSTSENKTYPTIQIQGYKGRAIIVVSCVTKDAPYKPHPHNLVGRDGCKRGVCTVEINSDNMTQSFDHLGIQCVKKKDIEEALRVRQEIRVDPFITGFQHKSQPGNIDLNAVRLCFQAFLENEPGKFKHALTPAVSDVIYDKKALCDLSICKLSHSSAPVSGGLPIIILCEKVAKEDIQVRFYEEQHNEIVWEGYGDFTPSHVHKQVAISLKTPKYRTIEVDRPVQVKIQLVRPSDKEQSLPLPFQLTPLDSGRPAFWSLRRYKVDYNNFSNILTADAKLLAKISSSENIPDITTDSILPSQPQQDTNNNHETPNPVVIDTYSVLKKNKESSCVVLEPPVIVMQPAQFSAGVDPIIQDFPVELSPEENNKLDNVLELVDESVEREFDDLIEQVDDLDDMINSGMDDGIKTGNDGIYTSFQMAMKNPFEFTDYNTSGYEDVIPPRPSAAKPVIRDEPDNPVNETDGDDVLPPLPPKRIRKSPPNKNLPPLPEGKKLNIFQKLFSSKRKDKSRKNSISSMGSRKSLTDEKSKTENLEQDDVTLTEAEHYALYTAFAPRATASEFDETSYYYSPVEGQSSYEEVSRKRPKRTSQQVEMDPQMLAIAGISGYGSPRIVKQEPGSSPSHVLLSPAGLHGYPSPSPQDMRSANSSPVYQPLVGNNPNTIYYPSSVSHGVYDSINPQTSPHLDYPQQPGLVFHPVIPEESQVNESSLTNINPTLNLSGVMSIDLDDNLSNLSLSNDPVQSRRGDMSDSFNKYLTTLADFTQ